MRCQLLDQQEGLGQRTKDDGVLQPDELITDVIQR